MLPVDDPDEIPPGGACWRCTRCSKKLIQLHRPISSAQSSRDPRLRGIRRKRQLWEVRVWIYDGEGPAPGTGGSGRGRRIIVGRFATLGEAMIAHLRAVGALGKRVRWQ